MFFVPTLYYLLFLLFSTKLFDSIYDLLVYFSAHPFKHLDLVLTYVDLFDDLLWNINLCISENYMNRIFPNKLFHYKKITKTLSFFQNKSTTYLTVIPLIFYALSLFQLL